MQYWEKGNNHCKDLIDPRTKDYIMENDMHWILDMRQIRRLDPAVMPDETMDIFSVL